MKKLLTAITIVLFVSLQACTFLKPDDNSSTEPSDSPTTSPATEATTTLSEEPKIRVSELFEVKDNLTLTYEGYNSEFAFLNIYTDYTDGDRVQRRIENGGTVVVEVLEINDGKLTKLVSRTEAFYRENLIPSAPDEGEVLLAEPIKTGNSWTLSDGRVRTITNTAAQVTTPSGSYTTVEVTTTDADNTVKDYYAPGTGLVKTSYLTGNYEVSSSLKKIERDGTLVQRIPLFYPSATDGNIYFITKDISFKTNDVTRLEISDIYRSIPDSSFIQVFSKKTTINSLYLNKDGMVYIDLSKPFIDDMNAGAAAELLILQSVVDTVGMYYGVDKIILTVENKPFETGHIEKKAGEPFTVSSQTTMWDR